MVSRDSRACRACRVLTDSREMSAPPARKGRGASRDLREHPVQRDRLAPSARKEPLEQQAPPVSRELPEPTEREERQVRRAQPAMWARPE
jgi:hypothetical protein